MGVEWVCAVTHTGKGVKSRVQIKGLSAVLIATTMTSNSWTTGLESHEQIETLFRDEYNE